MNRNTRRKHSGGDQILRPSSDEKILSDQEPVTIAEFDMRLRALNNALAKMAQVDVESTRRLQTELQMLIEFEALRDFMTRGLTGSRDVMCNVFGGSCRRIAHIQNAFDQTHFYTPGCKNDQRVQSCKNVAISVQEVLANAGYGDKLAEALPKEKLVVQNLWDIALGIKNREDVVFSDEEALGDDEEESSFGSSVSPSGQHTDRTNAVPMPSFLCKKQFREPEHDATMWDIKDVSGNVEKTLEGEGKPDDLLHLLDKMMNEMRTMRREVCQAQAQYDTTSPTNEDMLRHQELENGYERVAQEVGSLRQMTHDCMGVTAAANRIPLSPVKEEESPKENTSQPQSPTAGIVAGKTRNQLLVPEAAMESKARKSLVAPAAKSETGCCACLGIWK
eukprot:GEMP01035060.1.p1 GENE.GEMP01035060.1~~GEMP01035060.1.p1  ORF type:complete len:391 (+),score=96.26 GEMP01035060.1:248-1420(+)